MNECPICYEYEFFQQSMRMECQHCNKQICSDCYDKLEQDWTCPFCRQDFKIVYDEEEDQD